MESTDKEDQEDELLVLASIYEDDDVFIAGEEGNGGQFNAKLHMPEPFHLQLVGPLPPQLPTKGVKVTQNEDGNTLYPIKYTPPIVLNFQYPPDYPSCNAPSFTLSCKWLNVHQLSSLCKKLDSIWEENEGLVIVYMWTQFLSEEATDFLQLQSPLEISLLNNKETGNKTDTAQSSTNHDSNHGDTDVDCRAVQDIGSQGLLLVTMIEYNHTQQQRVFNSAVFTCNVCFNEKLGLSCINFQGCDHVYCKECMKEYFKVQIGEGNVKGLSCPDTDCESQALPSQVFELVGETLFERYDRLLLQTTLDGMADVVYCPRSSCQCAVMLEKESNMGVCPKCNFAFCTFCKLVYHGVSPCKIKTGERIKLREEYENGDEAQRKFLEKRYGKHVLKQCLEESYSEQWLESHSKSCPNCGTHIQKIDGCNKMTCTKCRAYFCWLCKAMVSRSNPYSHFNVPGSACFNQLFQGMENVEDDDDEDGWQPQWWFA